MMPNLNIDIDMRRDQSRGKMLSCTKMTAFKIDKINMNCAWKFGSFAVQQSGNQAQPFRLMYWWARLHWAGHLERCHDPASVESGQFGGLSLSRGGAAQPFIALWYLCWKYLDQVVISNVLYLIFKFCQFPIATYLLNICHFIVVRILFNFVCQLSTVLSIRRSVLDTNMQNRYETVQKVRLTF